MSILVKRSRCFCDRVLYSGVRIKKGETEELFTKKYVSNFLLYTLRFKKRLFNSTLGLKKESLSGPLSGEPDKVESDDGPDKDSIENK